MGIGAALRPLGRSDVICRPESQMDIITFIDSPGYLKLVIVLALCTFDREPSSHPLYANVAKSAP